MGRKEWLSSALTIFKLLLNPALAGAIGSFLLLTILDVTEMASYSTTLWLLAGWLLQTPA